MKNKYNTLVTNSEKMRIFGRFRHKWKDITKWILNKVRLWGGFMWLRIWTRGMLGSNIFFDILFIHEHMKNR